MLYEAYEMQRAWLAGASSLASASAEWLSHPLNPASHFGAGPVAASALEVFAHAASPRGKPAFGIASVRVGRRAWPVEEALIAQRPFGGLLRFARQGLPTEAPPILIIAPMSGHFATLLRGTVARLVENARVYITDWADAKMVPLAAGRFDLDDYIDYIIAFIEQVAADNGGAPPHVLAVCQPAVPALAATALMNADSHPERPLTLTMMGGPIDTREAPTSVNDLAVKRPYAWFAHNVIATVPLHYPGGGRKVYPGFLQLAGFLSMNLQTHMMSHWQMFRHLVAGDEESAEASKAFYDEYRSVADMTAEFYLQTIDTVFQRHALPKGELRHRGRPVDLGAIGDTALLAIEGERDDISGVGQTRAALTLTPNLPEAMKRYLLVEGVGHYGIFNGGRWRGRIAPEVEAWIAAHRTRARPPAAIRAVK